MKQIVLCCDLKLYHSDFNMTRKKSVANVKTRPIHIQ